jgi:hypothetical protein
VKKPLLLLSLIVVGALAFARWSMDDGDASDPALVLDRIWVDQLPRKPTDVVNAFAAVTQQPMGIFHSGSQWKASFEIFTYTYKGSGNELRIVYPQSNEDEKVKVRAWACRERGMDYCLELKGASRGVKRYRSRKGMEIGEATRPEQLRGRLESIIRLAP